MLRMKLGILGLIAVAILPISSGAMAAPAKGGAITVATIGEPPTLDPMVSTADLVGIITQHIFETLYTFDANWSVTPLVADAMPEISADGRIYTIKIRQGLTFHDGTALDADDVVASLKRWTEVASRGKLAAGNIEAIEKVDASTVKISLKQPFAPLLALLAFNNSAAVIVPSEKIAPEMKDPIGSGPYMLKARVPDQYIQLVRFDGYKPREGDPNGYGGARKQYLDEIRFTPVPNPNTRVEGAVAGQFDYTDSLPVEAVDKIKAGASEPIILKPFGWPVFVMNTKQGLLSDVKLRKAVQLALNEEDMLAAAFGSTDFYALDAAMYPEGYPWRSEVGTEIYNKGDAEGAQKLLEEAGYDGKTPIRILTSRQYEFHYKMALVAAEYLKAAGFQVTLDVTDWATLTQRRTDPALWEIYISHSPFLPEPALIGALAKGSPGWWDTPAKDKAVSAFNQALTQDERVKLWAGVQQVMADEVPLIKVGDFNALSAKSKALQGVTPAPWPYFWNAYVEK